jgi:hypothetical protein
VLTSLLAARTSLDFIGSIFPRQAAQVTPITAATVMITDRNIHQDQSAGDVQ